MGSYLGVVFSFSLPELCLLCWLWLQACLASAQLPSFGEYNLCNLT